MKISKLIFAMAITSTFLVSSCKDTKKEAKDDHGHEHKTDGSHINKEKVEQEEFQVETDSTKSDQEKHTHDNGDEHRDHGHEHNADGGHMNDEKVEQEEFQVETDSTTMKQEKHTHGNGEHHDH